MRPGGIIGLDYHHHITTLGVAHNQGGPILLRQWFISLNSYPTHTHTHPSEYSYKAVTRLLQGCYSVALGNHTRKRYMLCATLSGALAWIDTMLPQC